MNMPQNALAWIGDELSALETLGLRRTLRVREASQGAEILLHGEQVLNFGSNDYLGLAADPRLAEAAKAALQEEGCGAGASPLILGRGKFHAQLEERLARFEGTEAALVFTSGYAANVGTIAALAGRGDIVFSDEKNHASIIDGCRLSGARVQVFPHRHLELLENGLKQAGSFRRRMIVTDSLFSMDGDFAPLAELASLAEKYDAMLLVDEAHATGVFGPHGRGLCEQLGLEDRVHVRIGTLSKALGCAGGFVAGSQALIDWLANRARSYVFSTAPPGCVCAAAIRALEIVEQEPQRRTMLLERAANLRKALNAQGWQTGDSQSQIVPVFIGEPEPTMRLAQSLLERGIFVPGIRPPSVPEGQSLLRISLSYGHSDAMIHRLCEELKALQ